MKYWNFGLTVVCFVLVVLLQLQSYEIQDIKKKRANSSQLMDNVATMTLIYQAEQRSLNREYDKQGELLLKHNKLLIKNVYNGRLEKPDDEPQVVPAIAVLPYGPDR